MGATLNQLAEILAERSGRPYDLIFREEMKVIVNYWRARLIVDTLNAKPKDRAFFVRWIEIPLEQVSMSDFPGFPSDCKLLRTKCKLPRPVRANSKMFDFIGKLDRMTTIPLNEPYQIKALMHGKYTGKIGRAMEINGYLYIAGSLNLPGIAVAMIPEDVKEYQNCCTDCSSACEDDDTAYMVSEDLKQRIIQAALSTELRIPTLPEAVEVPVVNGAA